jgi:hypothetical protein
LTSGTFSTIEIEAVNFVLNIGHLGRREPVVQPTTLRQGRLRMKRIMLVLTAALVMAAMLVVTAAQALAASLKADQGLATAYAKSGGKSPLCDISCGPN